MTKLTNEQIRSILDGAPEGATHYQSTTWLRYNGSNWLWWSIAESGWRHVNADSLGWAENLNGPHGNLDDLREILSLRQEVERLGDENYNLKGEIEYAKRPGFIDVTARGEPKKEMCANCGNVKTIGENQ